MKKEEYIERYGEEAYQRHLEKCKQYREQHKEQYRNLYKQYYQQHKEYFKQYKEQHKEHSKQWFRKNEYMFAYCIPEEIEQIENYELAKKDNFKGWCIHHRLECVETGAEVNCSREALIDLNLYYNRPANELIFLTSSEHTKLHSRNIENRIL